MRHLPVVALALSIAFATLLSAAEPPKGPKPVEVAVELGTADDALRFVPDNLSFERGVYYRLVIRNPSPQAHYFTAEALATHAYTRKVEVLDEKGEPVAEIHGAIHDLELPPGGALAWYFYPMTNGKDMPLVCHKEGHKEGGMVGTITISGPPPFQPPSAQ
jgi:uncharacterized cupredoxin-like copper-binding protein